MRSINAPSLPSSFFPHKPLSVFTLLKRCTMLGMLGSLGGSLLSGVFGMMGQSSANEAAAQMAGTRYQTAYKDMMKAGLNPAMMFGSGGPAPMAPVGNTMAAPAAAMKDAASSAVAMEVAQKTIDQLTEQIAKTNAEAANVRAGTPGIAAQSSISSREADAISRIPDKVYVPVVQSGYGADKMRSTGPVGSGLGAAAVSAKSVKDTVLPDIGLSGPARSSAKELVASFKEKAPALGKALENWFERQLPPKYRKGSTHYKSN